jgi:hypothetical protein
MLFSLDSLVNLFFYLRLGGGAPFRCGIHGYIRYLALYVSSTCRLQGYLGTNVSRDTFATFASTFASAVRTVQPNSKFVTESLQNICVWQIGI